MREIKFRAWNTDGMVTQPLEGLFGLQRFLGFLHEDADLMQYTGLKDKNGKGIYEDDLFENEGYEPMRVVWMKEWACWGFDNGYVFSDFYADKMEIIGNIHENPELLGDTNE